MSKFSSSYKEISAALGAKPNTPVGAGGHPFDLCLEKLAPGQVSCPFHNHAAQWELFYIVSGFKHFLSATDAGYWDGEE
jgi:uncharacterized cupin superfamily protein